MADKKLFVVAESIETKILVIRGQKVMLDVDLAELYGVETKALNQAVKRNLERFPEDFMFRLTAAEKAEVVTNCDHLTKLNFSQSCLMLSPNTAHSCSAMCSNQQERSRSV